MDKNPHLPVLIKESIQALCIKPDGCYLDATFGCGGHSRFILEHLNRGKLIGIDRDPNAYQYAKQLLSSKFDFHQSNFADIKSYLEENNIFKKVDGVLMDLGVSSPQLDTPQRGFSFIKDGPLDMRMSQEGRTVAEWINEAAYQEIAKVLRLYGDEKMALPIAKKIAYRRTKHPIQTTHELADIVKEVIPSYKVKHHPATRTFQALRIFINDEIGSLKRALKTFFDALNIGGRLVVISFHSLEDRLVKRFFQDLAADPTPKKIPIKGIPMTPIKIIGRAVKASPEEVKLNVRSRSAVLRVAEKRMEVRH